MRIPMADVPEDGLELAGTATVDLEAGDDGLSACAVVAYELSVTLVGECRRVSGSLSTAIEVSCSRCAQRYVHDLKRDFEVLYQRLSEGSRTRRQELDEQDMSLDYYEDDAIEVQRFLAEQVLLALPMKLLCNADCKGLCAQCGANRNVDECDCKEEVDPRLSPLAAIRDQL